MGVAQLNVIQNALHAQALQFHRKAHKAGGHQGKRAHTRDCRCFFAWKHKPPLHNYCTFHHHRFQVQACPFYCRNCNKADAINSEVKKEHGLFSWRNTAAGCFSYAGKGKTVSHTLLKITVGVQGKLIGFRTLLDLIHGSDAGHHYSNAVRVCINENWWIPFLQTQKKGCVHKAASKDLPSLWEMKSMLAGCSISHHFNMFPSNSKQIWRVNKFTSAFLQSQNFKVKQSQK